MPKKICFVVGPIGKEGSDERRHADWLLHGIISPVLDEFEYDVLRSDKIGGSRSYNISRSTISRSTA